MGTSVDIFMGRFVGELSWGVLEGPKKNRDWEKRQKGGGKTYRAILGREKVLHARFL